MKSRANPFQIAQVADDHRPRRRLNPRQAGGQQNLVLHRRRKVLEHVHDLHLAATLEVVLAERARFSRARREFRSSPATNKIMRYRSRPPEAEAGAFPTLIAGLSFPRRNWIVCRDFAGLHLEAQYGCRCCSRSGRDTGSNGLSHLSRGCLAGKTILFHNGSNITPRIRSIAKRSRLR